jgi:hypothetical protein
MNALDSRVWAPGRFHSISSNTEFYEMSQDVTHATVFISHNWGDSGDRKLTQLRELMSIAPFLVSTTVALVVLGFFFLPLSVALNSLIRSFPPLGLPAIFACLLLLPLLWVAISFVPCWPSRFAPWRFSSVTVWVDRCCGACSPW